MHTGEEIKIGEDIYIIKKILSNGDVIVELKENRHE